eukprot:6185784-Pleurochrysis_carterae.AAC.2
MDSDGSTEASPMLPGKSPRRPAAELLKTDPLHIVPSQYTNASSRAHFGTDRILMCCAPKSHPGYSTYSANNVRNHSREDDALCSTLLDVPAYANAHMIIRARV